MTPAGSGGGLRAFRHRDFAILWSGSFVSSIGTWMQTLAIPFVIFQLTGSPLWVGASAAAQYVPSFVAGPIGGWVADHRTRRTTLLTTQSVQAVVATALWLCWVLGARSPYLLLGVVAISGFVQGINLPSWQTFVNDLVPREDLRSAVTMNSLQFNAARAIGPALAGITLALLGAAWAFAFNALSFAAVIGALALVRTRGKPNYEGERHGIIRSFAMTISYGMRDPSVSTVMLTTILLGGLGFPVMTFTIILAGDVYQVGPAALGLMTTAIGVGSILAAPTVSGWPRVVPLSRIALISLVVFGCALLALAIVPFYAAGVVALTFVGAAFLGGTSGVNASLQLRVDAQQRGRALALRLMLFTLTAAIGSFLQGVAAEHLGPRWTMAVYGVLMIGATSVLALNRTTLSLRSLDPPRQHKDLPIPDTLKPGLAN